MSIRITLILVSFFLTIYSARADWVKKWKPSELFERAEVVIIGQPTEINATGKKGTIRLNPRHTAPSAIFKAKVRVVEVIKGEALIGENGHLKAEEIAITYSRVDETKRENVHLDYVYRIDLKKDGLFLLYLNRSKEGGYVNALEGERNDYQAAKPLRAKAAVQAGASRPATALESKPEGNKKSKPESEGRSQ